MPVRLPVGRSIPLPAPGPWRVSVDWTDPAGQREHRTSVGALAVGALIVGADDTLLGDAYLLSGCRRVAPGGGSRLLEASPPPSGCGTSGQSASVTRTERVQAIVDPATLSDTAAGLYVVLGCPDANAGIGGRGEGLSAVRDLVILLTDLPTGQPIARYELDHRLSTETAVVLGELYRRSPESWRFRGRAEAATTGLTGLAARHRAPRATGHPPRRAPRER